MTGGVPKQAIMTVLHQATQQPETVAMFQSEKLDGDGYELQSVVDVTDHLHELEDQEQPEDAFVRGFLTALVWQNTYRVNGTVDAKKVARRFARGEERPDELMFDGPFMIDEKDLTK
jgi:hypothetical protein